MTARITILVPNMQDSADRDVLREQMEKDALMMTQDWLGEDVPVGTKVEFLHGTGSDIIPSDFTRARGL